AGFRRCRQRIEEIRWQGWFQLPSHRRNLKRHRFSHYRATGFTQRAVDPEPMAQLTVRLQHGLERLPVDAAFHAGPAAPWKLLADGFWQQHERPVLAPACTGRAEQRRRKAE